MLAVSASGGVCSEGGVSAVGVVSALGDVSALGGCLLQGVSAPGGGVAGIPACTEADTLSPLLTESQTPVKTLPWLPTSLRPVKMTTVVALLRYVSDAIMPNFVIFFKSLLSKTVSH